MKSQMFLSAKEVAIKLGVSMAYAYKLIRTLNDDLKKQGFITINGRVSTQYFFEKLYGSNAGGGKGEKMPAYKDDKTGTWYTYFRYSDWTGERKQKMKRGFPTKREALEWERTFLQKTAADLSMAFAIWRNI